MAEGRSRDQWSRTASLMAHLANVNRVKGPPARPGDFDPYEMKKKRKLPMLSRGNGFEILKQVFVDRKGAGT